MDILSRKQTTQIAKLIISVILLLCSHFVLSQNNKQGSSGMENIHHLPPPKDLDMAVELGLKARGALIKLITYPRLSLKPEDYNRYEKLHDSLLVNPDAKIIDSVTITLKSGLSWNIHDEPPKALKHSFFKPMTKKSETGQAVNNRLKYLHFRGSWDAEGTMPCEMVEKFNRYYAIEIDDVKYLKLDFELKYNEEGRLKISDKKIWFHD